MITTILIVLVAVVVLIVIIAVLALRYLRADDSDTFDDIPDEPRRAQRRPGPGSDHLPAEPDRSSRQRAAAGAKFAADRQVRPSDNRAKPGYRDRDTGPRPAVPERVSSQASGRQRLAAAAARPARSARADEPDAATNSWESLSDVDYWAELAAADKPQLSSAGSGPAPTARRPQGSRPDARQPAGAPTAHGDRGQPPPGQRPQPNRAPAPLPSRGAEPLPAASPSLDGPGRRGAPRPTQAPRPAATQRQASGPHQVMPTRPPLPAAQAPSGNGHARPGRPADDDPLTSPSFPAITTSDSRSYRTRRGNSQPGITGPNGYPVQPPATSPAAQASQRQAPTAPSNAPAANPYGSYVSAPPPAYQQPAYPQQGYQDAAVASPGAGYPAAPAAAAVSSAWHGASALDAGGPSGPSAADGYLSGADLGTGSGGGRHRTSQSQNGSAPRGYAGIDYGTLRYDDPVYPDVSYGQDGYQGYQGYGTDRR